MINDFKFFLQKIQDFKIPLSLFFFLKFMALIFFFFCYFIKVAACKLQILVALYYVIITVASSRGCSILTRCWKNGPLAYSVNLHTYHFFLTEIQNGFTHRNKQLCFMTVTSQLSSLRP